MDLPERLTMMVSCSVSFVNGLRAARFATAFASFPEYPLMKPLAVIVIYAAIGVTTAHSPKYTSSGARYSRD